MDDTHRQLMQHDRATLNPVTGPARGITSTEARRALARVGPNETRPPRRPRAWRRVVQQLTDPLILLLLGAAVVTVLAGDFPDTIVILVVIVVNTTIGITQEIRADRAVDALRHLGAPSCRVVRDGTEQLVPLREIVPGDLVVLSAGDLIPADLRATETYRLRLDESALTGESEPLRRHTGDELSAGTVVSAGRAVGRVLRTGNSSALGRITNLTERAHSGPTPLQHRLASLGRLLGTLIVVVSALVSAFGIAQGRPPLEMAIVGVSLVVAAVPESLPAVVTLALSLGARRMAAAHAITRQLTAVETLGSVGVLASDKTGTLTQGRMAVEQAATVDGALYRVSGAGYAPAGSVSPLPGQLLEHVARAAVLCNDASLVPPSGSRPDWSVAGEQLEGALLAFAARVGVDIDASRHDWPRSAEEPFDQRRRMMTTTHLAQPGTEYTAMKGAPESVLADPRVAATEDERHVVEDATARFASAGLRTLALAGGWGAHLHLLGVLGVGDPLRPDAGQVLRRLERAGIRTVIVTGDHARTARSIAERLGIWREGDHIVDCGREGWPSRNRHTIRVFARAHPEEKLEIVRALQEDGAIVAVTGDGVNDAPALRKADIGVAMGSGTDVAQQAARLVLSDDSLATLVHAVKEGRRVYDNVRRFLRYGLSGGVAELATMLLGPLMGLPVPLLPAQILWINLLTHGLPGVAMGAEPADGHAMSRPPRSPDESVLGDGLGRSVLAIAALIAACTLGIGVLAHHLALPWQTMMFLELGLAQLGVAWAVRAPRTAGNTNPWLSISIAASVALMLMGVWLPALQALLGTQPIGGPALALVVAVGLVPGSATAVATWIRQRQQSASGTRRGT